MTKVFAVSNQKGGVGKTTTSVNLATALAACKKRVLVIDLDPQGNSTTAFGLDKGVSSKTVYDVIMGRARFVDVVRSTAVPGLDVLPSTIHLSGAEVELVPAMAREYKLKEALDGWVDRYDYVFIDCPPSLGLLTLNALALATDVLVPVQCEFLAMEGLSQLFQTISSVKHKINPGLNIFGVLLTMFDTRNRLSASVEYEIRNHLKDKVLDTVVPRNVRISEAPSYGKPVLLYDMKCAGSLAYMRLASEFIKREKTRITGFSSIAATSEIRAVS